MKEFYQVSKKFKNFLIEIIDERKKEIDNNCEPRYDLLSRMMYQTQNDLVSLTKTELIGNA